MMRLQWTCALAVLCGLAALAAQAEVLDQQNDLTGSAAADSTSGGFSENAQTFTPGVTGTLDRIEVQIVRFFGSGGNAIVSVYNTSGGFPTGVSLGSQTLAWDLIPTTGYAYQVFDFSSMAIPITSGTMMAFGVSSTTEGATGGVRISFNMSTYAGGEAKFRQANPNGPWQNFSFSHDYGFKTYVEVSAGLPGDFNNDGMIDAADYVVWRDHEGEPTEAAIGNNGDGMNGVDAADYSLWQANFGAGVGKSASDGAAFIANVPEPATMEFAAAIGWFATGLRRRGPFLCRVFAA